MDRRLAWLVPLTGVAFVVAGVLGFLVQGDTPDPTDDSAAEIAAFYSGNDGQLLASVALAVIAAPLLVFFGAYLRDVLTRDDGVGRIPAVVAFAGSVILAVGFAIDATITITLQETVDDLDPAAVQALSALYNNDFIPLAVGSATFLLGAGIAIVVGRTLPVWIGWLAIVLGVLAATPIGFVSFIGMAVVVLVISVMLSLRARDVAAPRVSPSA